VTHDEKSNPLYKSPLTDLGVIETSDAWLADTGCSISIDDLDLKSAALCRADMRLNDVDESQATNSLLVLSNCGDEILDPAV